MTTDVNIKAECDLGTLEKLGEAIALRESELGEMTSDAVIATSINILRSLKARTLDAGEDPEPIMFRTYKLGEVAGWYGGKGGGPRRRVARQGGLHGPRLQGVYPVNLMYGLKGPGEVWQITLKNPNVPWKRTKNKGRYVLLAPNSTVALRYAADRVRRLLKKEHGMAKYALSIAQHALSTRGDRAERPKSANAFKIAYDAAQLQVKSTGYGEGSVGVSFLDDLRYSGAAAGGDGALQNAIQLAVNSTVGRINANLRDHFSTRRYPTPFPEAKKK